MNKREVVSTDDLLKALTEEGSTSNIKHSLLDEDNVLRFIDAFEITEGNEPVSISNLYKLYKSWSKTEFLTLTIFKRTLFNLLDGDKRNKRRGYYAYLDVDSLKLTDKAKQAFIDSYERDPRFKSRRYMEEIKTFLGDMGIETGQYAVPLTTLYYIFCSWSDIAETVSLTMFDEYLKLSLDYDKRRKVNNDTVFFVDKHNVNITGELLDKAKAFTQRTKKDNKQTKYKKLKEEIS